MEHQQIPVSLNDLVPDYLDHVPPDPYDGKPLRFERWDGGYRVYSVERRSRGRGGHILEYGSDYNQSVFGFEVPRPTKRVDTGQGIEPPAGYSGHWQVFWPNGQLKHKTLYIKGSPDGEWTTYFEDGKPEVTRQYEQGEINGIELQRFSDGTSTETQYDHGKRIRRCVTVSASGDFVIEEGSGRAYGIEIPKRSNL